jgi:hypothetical protein
MAYTHLTESQIAQLVTQGCSAANWDDVTVAAGCDLTRIVRSKFLGTVRIGDAGGSHAVDGVELPNGIYDAVLADCDVGDHVRISRIGSVVSNYFIDQDVLIEDVAALVADKDATYGNGIELETINEGGGRGVKIINDLTSQTAYLQGMLRHNKAFTEKLQMLIDASVNDSRQEQGGVAQGARLIHCGTIRNVNIGPKAYVHGAQLLENGTILSCPEHPTEIGEGVQAKSFIVAEGARVESGAVLDKVFVGQAVKMGKQFSAENSLFFANCEAFHGEAVSLFAGPYTVTHHKSTLLIAGLFSFYNAGSGSNQSNHMYKLGPVHQGVFERGCKTGSFSYLLLEAHIGAFTVVIGKHYANLDVSNLPFSYISEEEGNSKIVPGMNLVSVGTVRDGEKWPKRDGRKAPNKRDLIIFDVFSPYTVEKMRCGRDELLSLSERVPKEKVSVTYGGAQLSRLLLKKGAKFYSLAIARYILGTLMEKLKESLAVHPAWSDAVAALKPTAGLRNSSLWTDISGLLTPQEKLADLESRLAAGSITSYKQLLSECKSLYEGYRAAEWQYVADVFATEYGAAVESLTKEKALAAADEWESASTSLLGMILDDSKKEFGAFARVGYGLDQSEAGLQSDFEAVRGTIETNSVVQKLVSEGAAIRERKEQFKSIISAA